MMNTFLRKNLLVATGGLFVLTGVSGVALAAKPSSATTSMGTGEQIASRIEKRIFRIIHADDAQKEKLTSIFNATFEQNTELRNELKSKALELSKAYADDSVSNQQIKDRIVAIDELRAKLRTKRVEALLSAREVLSSKQRQILSERLHERFGDD